MIKRTVIEQENRTGNEVGTKVVVSGNKTLTCLASATQVEINSAFSESEEMDNVDRNWVEKGKPWTEDDEAFLDRMSS